MNRNESGPAADPTRSKPVANRNHRLVSDVNRPPVSVVLAAPCYVAALLLVALLVGIASIVLAIASVLAGPR